MRVVDFYNSIKDAIPRHWRNMLKDSRSVNICMDLKAKLTNSKKDINIISNKEVYWTFVNSVIVTPTSVKKWEEIYPDLAFNWEYIFITPFSSARETSIRSLQYKILHRFFPCNYTLSKWFSNQTNICNFCSEIDNLEHYFFNCKHVEIFWSSFYKWWQNTTQVQLQLNCLDVIFGIHNPNSYNIIACYNYCILLAKDYIYRQKKEMNNCCFYQYQITLKNRLDCESLLSIETETEKHFSEKWSDIYDLL